MSIEMNLKREDAHYHHVRLTTTITGLQQRQEALWKEIMNDVAHPFFTERMREANLLAGRIEVLQERLSNIACGLPEMGLSVETIRPNTLKSFK